MKKIYIVAGLGLVLLGACSKSFLDKKPLGVASLSNLNSADGVNSLLIGAYSLMDGEADQSGYNFGSGAENWVWADVTGGNSYKGSDPGDQPDLLSIETFSENAANSYPGQKYRACYEGISRVNQTILALGTVPGMTDAAKTEIMAEARFLRGYYHFEVKKVFNNIPYVDETVKDAHVSNTVDAYPKIEADFAFAVANLPLTQSDKGRPTKYAAQALLAKVYMFETKFAQALPLLNAIISSGAYSLMPNYYDDFNAEKRNNKEEIYQVQYTVNDGITATNSNGNYGDILNYPNGSGPIGCCGFNQPSQNLVNAFKTDLVTGLPLLDTYNASDLKSDQGLKSTDPYTPDRVTPVDPRLDWTVGRRGIPYLDWGNHKGFDWIRNQASAGPYSPKKTMFRKSQNGALSQTSGWDNALNANNYSVVRYADVLLLAAECEVEIGSLPNALNYVNMIRARAAASPVYQRKSDNSGDSTALAANYFVGQYPAFPSQDYARKAVQFERRLELAMEGHWFYDLVRWKRAATFINNEYLPVESAKRPFLVGAKFTPGKSEYFPLPQTQIDLSTQGGKATLIQNPGY